MGNEIDDKILQEEKDYVAKFENLPSVNSWDIFEVVENTWNFLSGVGKQELSIPETMEEFVKYEPTGNNDVFVGGTYDYMYDKVVGDYKTCTRVPSKISTHHRIQLLIYSWILINNYDRKVEYIEVTYIQKFNKGEISEKTGNVIKQVKPKIVVIKEPITQDGLDYVLQEMINLGRRISLAKADNSLAELLFPHNPLSHFN